MSEIIRLENDRFTALIDVLGAQLRSLRLKDGGGELIWPGEPAVWRE